MRILKAIVIIILLVHVCYADDYCVTPESVGAFLLTDTTSIATEYSKYQSMVIADLKKRNEIPGDFYVQIEKKGEVIKFELWHKSAFYPENCGAIGNPGGLCRTIVIENGKIMGHFWWQ